MKRIAINENGIHMVFEVRRDKVRWCISPPFR